MYNFGYIYSHTAQYTTFILHFCDAYLVGDFISCVCIFQISRSRGTGLDRGLNPRSQAPLFLSDELTVSSIALHRASGGGTRAGPGAGHGEQGGRSAVLPSHERLIRNDAVVELIRKGDILKINVGGGGGHRLIRIPQYFCE